MNVTGWVLAAAVGLAQPGSAAPPAPVASEPPPTEVAEVVVTARRLGVPVWRVGDDRSAIVFVGVIGAIPESVPWNVAVLEEAVAGSRGVLHSVSIAITAGDVFRLLFRGGRYTDLPRGQSLETQIGPALSARIDRLAAAGRIPRGWRNARAWWVASRLRVGLAREREIERGTSVTEAAERAARRARRPIRPIVRTQLNDVLNQAARDRPGDLACLEAVVTANEAGVPGVRQRAVDWTRSRLQAVADAPQSRAEAVCWPEMDRENAPALRNAWRAAVRQELTRPGAIVALVPVRYLTEQGGLLDDLEAQGHAIDGPRWR